VDLFKRTIGGIVKINISNLSEGKHEYQLSESSEELGLKENFFGSIKVNAEVEKSSRQIFLRAQVAARAKFQCDRCLDMFDRSLTTGYKAVYMWNTNDAHAGEMDDVHFLTRDTNIINISDDVKQYLLLSVPLKLLCNDNCAGLCPSCGKNLNHVAGGKCNCTEEKMDPRWESLVRVTRKTISSGNH
jgi:DUF177 domain-containing protein